MSNQILTKLLMITAVLLLAVFPATGQTGLSHAGKPIIVFFRYDDISGRSSYALERKLIDLFRKHGFSLTVGVIPYVCDRDFHDPAAQGNLELTPQTVKMLREAASDHTVDVALHGYTHQTVRSRDEGNYTEFSGVNYEIQEKKLIKGKLMLEKALQLKISTFIPPFNSYDRNTIRAVEKLGLTYFSANRWGTANESSSLWYLPVTCEPSRVREAVESARTLPDLQPVIGILLHQFDFTDLDKKHGLMSYAEFVRLMDWLDASKDVKVMSLDQAADMLKDLGPRRLLDNRTYLRMFRLIPKYFVEPKMIYLTSATAAREQNKLRALIAFPYVAAFIFSGFVAFRQRKRLMSGARLYTGIIVILSPLLCFAAIYLLTDKEIGGRGLMAINILAGSGFGLLISNLKLKKLFRTNGCSQQACSDERSKHQ
jgi:peptidoglycan/xylan/chitin deacetylase (PgdA/CDA1 family)